MLSFFISQTIKYERIEHIMNDGKSTGWRKNVIRDLESQYGNLEEIIPKLVNQGGQTFAAFQLNTTATTISKWLKEHDYVQKVEWVKRGELETAS
jgi:hypothetical protein